MFWGVRLEVTTTVQKIVLVMVAIITFGVAIIPTRQIFVSVPVTEVILTAIHLVSVANEKQQV